MNLVGKQAPDFELEGFFNGQFSTSFSSVFQEPDRLIGVVTDITGVSGGFFEQGFHDNSSLVTTQVIPAPSALVLGGLGLCLVGRVRRRTD